MDFLAILRFVVDHNNQVLGGLVALFILTSIVLLVRTIGSKEEGSGAHSSSPGAEIDVAAIEGAMKRVLASQPVSVVAVPGSAATSSRADGGSPSPTAGEGDSEQAAQLAAAVQEREEQIQELKKELEKAKADAAKASAAGGKSGEGSNAPPGELQAKIDELQARLFEYEIIEDDIADLSLFKDENQRLKQEVETLKAELEKAASAPPPVAAPAAPRSMIKSEGEATLKFEKADKFELDPNDDVMKQFAAAVEVQQAPPAQAASSIPQQSIDDVFSQAAAEADALVGSAQSTGAAPVASSVPAAAAVDGDPQSAIDALFAQAQSETVSPSPVAAAAPATAVAEDPQSAIDAMFAQAEKETPKADAPTAADPQSAIDALFAQAESATEKSDGKSEIAAPSPVAPASAAVDPQSEIDALFAAAESEQAPGKASESDEETDPFGTLDTAKMLSEVESLNIDVADAGDALADSLDTDRLLAEVGSLEADSSGSAATPATPSAVRDQKAQAPEAHLDAAVEDDLLAEFKDTSKTGT